MEPKEKYPELVEELRKTRLNDPDLKAMGAIAGNYQPLELVSVEVGRDQPIESVVADAGSGERLEPLGAVAGKKQSVDTVAAEAEETAKRQDDPEASYTASGARPQPMADMPRVVARAPRHTHPLQHRWSLWFYRKDRRRSWEENLMEVTSFQSMEDFWALQSYIEPASNLRRGCDYALFRYGIEPSWEDGRNRDGGHWLFVVDRCRRDVDRDWREVLLCLVAEDFGEHSRDVCGAVVQVRSREDKIAVWTTDSSREEANLVIGRTLKEKLKLHPRILIPYRSHADIMQAEDGVEVKAKYVA